MNNNRRLKLIAFIAVMVLLINSIIPASALVNTNIIYCETSQVSAGSTAEIPIRISNNSGIAGFSIYISYDPDVFTPISVTDTNGIIPGRTQNSIGGNLPHIPENTVKITCSGDSNFSADGLLFTVRFSVAPTASGSTVLYVSYDEDDTIDEDINEVELSCSDISLSILNPGIDSLPQIELAAVNDAMNHRVLLHGVLKEPNGLTSATISLQFDASAFRYISASSTAAIFGISQAAGTLSFSLSSINTVGKGEELFEIVFAYNAGISAGTYQFSGSAASVGGANGIHFIDCSTELSNVPNASAVITSVSGLKNNQGHIVSVPILIQNNPGLMGYKLAFSFNNADITPLRAVNDLLFPTGSLRDNIGTRPNSFNILWNGIDPSAENGQLFRIEFEVLTNTVKETEITVTYSAPDTFDGSYNDVLLQCSNITISLNSYTEVRNAQEATCCEAGYTGDTYCLDCGQKLSTGSTIPATSNHVDANGVWESDEIQHWHTCYFGTMFDAAAHAFSNGVCTVCGAAAAEGSPTLDSNLVIYNVGMSLQSSIIFNVTVRNTALANYDSYYMEFSRYDYVAADTLTENVTGVVQGTKYQRFDYKVYSFKMTDDITMTVHAFKNGVEYVGPSAVYSVESYALSKIAAATEAQKKLFADLLQYGAMAQTYFNYNTAELANANLDDFSSYITTGAPTVVSQQSNTGSSGDQVTLRQCALGLQDAVKIQFAVRLATGVDVNNLYALITYDGAETTDRVEGADFVTSGKNKVIFVDNLLVTQGKTAATVTVYDKTTNQPVSGAFTYSIQSYVYDKQNAGTTTEAVMNTLNAMMNYYNSAYAVFVQ